MSILDELGNLIAELQSTPGRLVDAGGGRVVRRVDHATTVPTRIRQTSRSATTRKARVVGFLLDIEIRRATNNAKSLDDVMRLAWRRYSRRSRFHAGRIPRAASRKWPASDLSAWLQQALDIDRRARLLAGALARPADPHRCAVRRRAPGSASRCRAATPTLKNDGGRLVVTQVRRGTPAYDAGVNVDDEILAIGDYRVRPEGWEARLDAYRPGDRVTLLVARREHLTPDRRGICAGTGASHPYRAGLCRPIAASARSAGDMVEAVTASRLS